MQKPITICFLFFLPVSLSAQGWGWQNPFPHGNEIRGVEVISDAVAVLVGELGTVMKTTDSGKTWDFRYNIGGISSTLHSVSFGDSQCGWAVGSEGVIIQTIDGGLTWAPYPSGVLDALFSVHFVDSQTGWIVGNGGIVLRTTNGGQTWDTQSNGSTGPLYAVFFSTANLGWAAGGQGKIFGTTDGGANWIEQATPTVANLHDIHFTDSLTGWVVGRGETILHTTDGGVVWTLQDGPGATSRLESVHFVNNNEGWVVGWDGVILRTLDGGQTWTLEPTGTFSRFYAVAFSDSSIGWASGNQLLFAFDGVSWTDMLTDVTNEDLSTIYFIDRNVGWAAGFQGTILHTDDGGISWTSQASGTNAHLESIFSCDLNNAWVVGGDMILKTQDGGVIWTSQVSGLPGSLRSIFFADCNKGWIAGDGGAILHTTNGGAEWFQQSTGVTGGINAVSFEDDLNGWAAGNGFVLKTTNGGNSWEKTELLGNLKWIEFVDAGLGWTSGGLFFYRTTDNGTTWSQSLMHGTSFGMDFVDPNNGWGVGPLGTAGRTGDSGTSWTLQQTPWDDDLHAVSFVDANRGWAAGERGIILYTTTGGTGIEPPPAPSLQTPPDGSPASIDPTLAWDRLPSALWYTVQVSLSPYFITHILNQSNIADTSLILADLIPGTTYYWRVSVTADSSTSEWSETWSFSTLPTSVSEDEDIPTVFSLSQNYPNPFNPSTTIAFDLPVPEHVTLRIFNLLGEETVTLVSGQMQPGGHSIQWDAHGLPSGVYFYRMQAGEFTETRKLLLLR